MNSAMVVKIAIVATVTVGDMDVAVEPIGTYSRRVTGETMTIHPTHLTTNLSRFGAKAFSQMNSSMIVKNGIVATVSVGSIAALSHLTHKDMGNATMMSGTS
ncbi:hypothetical protein [Shewanella xiamenensis]|uniref:hypothetical protein n=2 Tax=Shewanella xiamenensis TaxID=332186 RepID=UPI0008498B97|nr:hypothetical protein [Shewanella xiamenensis]ODR86964.1 hypothetical protein ABT47_17605 [Shewanella xiamenensis]